MSTKFFTNEPANTLFEKFKGIAEGMGLNFHTFLAATGYFRSSGYFKLRKEIQNTSQIKVLVGIDLDNAFRQNEAKGTMWFGDRDEAHRLFDEAFIKDVKDAKYTQEVEEGILQMIDDLKSGRLEMRIHPSKNIHAKFYLCLPEKHTENSDGWVIMGSSNLTDEGLGIKACDRYELNVSLKDYDDVKFCHDEFEKLWAQGDLVRIEDIERNTKKTHLGIDPTPWELYMKVLITYFGAQAEDTFSMDMPKGMMKLKYQTDAVIQAYSILNEHNGCILGDVVGLGKTVVAVMVAKRFIEENGPRTKILVAYPPSVAENWKQTVEDFGISRYVHTVSSFNLKQVLNGTNKYRHQSEYDMVIVDEAHNFRNARTNGFDELQTICKSPRGNPGNVDGCQKKILLLSATAVNNSPEDLKNEILLFQDARRCTVENIPDLSTYFAPKISKYKETNRKWKKEEIDKAQAMGTFDTIYEEIRSDVLDKLTVRRTRKNIMGNPDYKKDLEKQKIEFPQVLPPKAITYEMDTALEKLFWETRNKLANIGEDGCMTYARYRAIEFLDEGKFKDGYDKAKQVSDILAGVYKTFMVKRLESSFAAFRKSVDNFIRITEYMIRMFEEDKVLVIPEMNVNEQLAKEASIDEIIEKALERYDYSNAGEICYQASDFKPEFRQMLESDVAALKEIRKAWSCDNVSEDPKFERFLTEMQLNLLDEKINPSGKLVIFSESVDTVNYLKSELEKRGYGKHGILAISSGNRNKLRAAILENFDANAKKKSNDYHFLITSDALAEGVNLHAANVIVNYDTPWNATRLIQRVGRLNRIGSTAGTIHNYLFYPSDAGNKAIALKQTSMMKAQGFQSALGEDGQIFSLDEIVREFKLYDENVVDSTDRRMEFLRVVRDLYQNERDEYNRIKSFPAKVRCFRKGDGAEKSIAFIASNRRGEFTVIEGHGKKHLGLVEAADLLKADRHEKPIEPPPKLMNRHFNDIGMAIEEFHREAEVAAAPAEPAVLPQNSPKNMKMAYNFLKRCDQLCEAGGLSAGLRPTIGDLKRSVAGGVYAHLENNLAKLAKRFPNGHIYSEQDYAAIVAALNDLAGKYLPAECEQGDDSVDTDPVIIISETFSAS